MSHLNLKILLYFHILVHHFYSSKHLVYLLFHPINPSHQSISSVHLSRPFTCLPAHPSICSIHQIHPSVHLSVRLPTHPPARLSDQTIYSAFYLSISWCSDVVITCRRSRRPCLHKIPQVTLLLRRHSNQLPTCCLRHSTQRKSTYLLMRLYYWHLLHTVFTVHDILEKI